MKFSLTKILVSCLLLSIVTSIIGYFLWAILIPIQDLDPIDREELLRTQKELALNYTMGKNLLYIGFFGFICSAICLLLNKIKTLKNKFNRS
ncbi:hypothetical protein Q783_06070 [Carnobacterium inhibens subsp. gilichinskyi]|uniref:Uncharacterized protein n=1 Tax=Carnobacterium inhibens subsp. gilichinskyi TaxID=1266845 RepID=U5S9B1_9LACT|nr:hypothetical protein Q783_06070 [Carnobacterium inhibens subsp. gilichinskyi]